MVMPMTTVMTPATPMVMTPTTPMTVIGSIWSSILTSILTSNNSYEDENQYDGVHFVDNFCGFLSN